MHQKLPWPINIINIFSVECPESMGTMKSNYASTTHIHTQTAAVAAVHRRKFISKIPIKNEFIIDLDQTRPNEMVPAKHNKQKNRLSNNNRNESNETCCR